MEKVRIGNDIQVKYTVLRDGLPESFVGATNIVVTVKNEAYGKIVPSTFSILNNIVTISLDAADCVLCGKHRVTLSYNRGNDITIDALAFELVQFTSLTGGTEIVGVEIVTVNISGDIGIAIPDNNKIDFDGLNSNIDKLHFKPDTLVQLAEIGDVRYSTESKTLEVKVSDTVSIQLGQEMQTRVKNDAGVQIDNGQLVYINSAAGANPLAKIASTTDADIAQRTFGIATENIANNGFGAITTEGLVRDVNTAAFTEGDMLWLGVNGTVTNIEPVAPTPKISVGMVLRSNVNSGVIYVKIRAIARNQKLSDVYAPTLTGGDILRWNSATLRFETFNITTALAGKADLVGGKIPTSQLPSYVDDVLEYTNLAAFPSTGETGKIYVALDTNLTYRWSGAAYIEISKSLALGEASSTAYRGDRGKTAYDHSQTTGNAHGTTAAQIPNAPAGTVVSTTVQGAINELASDIVQVETDLNKCSTSNSITNYLLNSPPVDYYPGNVITVDNSIYYPGNYGIKVPANTLMGYITRCFVELDITGYIGQEITFSTRLISSIANKFGLWGKIAWGYYLLGNPNAVQMGRITKAQLLTEQGKEYPISFTTTIQPTWGKIYIAAYGTGSTTTSTEEVTFYRDFVYVAFADKYDNAIKYLSKKINSSTNIAEFGDPRSYGAVYDGVTDCSAAINACIQDYRHVKFIGNGIALCANSIIVKENTWLELDYLFTIKLANGTNKPLIKNKWAEQAYFMGKNLINGAVPSFMPEVYPNYGAYPSANYILGAAEKNIKITGGKLDGNGANQTRQDYRYGSIGYWGILMAIVNVDGFELRNITLFDPCTYNTDFCLLKNFVIENIKFDYLSPRANIDGIHFDGECSNGVVVNVFGKTNDDMVTFNGGDSWYPKNVGGAITTEANRLWYPFKQGKIENITVKNIFATNGYRASRLLSNKKVVGVSPETETEGMNNILIDGVYGTFKTDIFLISNHYGEAKNYGHLTFKNIHVISSGTNNINIEACNIDSLVIDSMNYFATNKTKQLMLTSATIKSLLLSNLMVNANGNDLSALAMVQNNGNISKLKLFNAINKDANYLATSNGAVTIESLFSDFN